MNGTNGVIGIANREICEQLLERMLSKLWMELEVAESRSAILFETNLDLKSIDFVKVEQYPSTGNNN